MSTAFRRRRCLFLRWHMFRIPPAVVTSVVAFLISLSCIRGLELQLRPLLVPLAHTQVQNKVTVLLEDAVHSSLEQLNPAYGDLVTIQRDSDGRISLLTVDTAAMNRLRLSLISQVLDTLSRETVTPVRVPLGSLLDSEFIWARGPAISVHTLSLGTVHGEFESSFSDAGVNQTLHRIELVLSVPVTVLLPGGPLDVPVSTSLCVAETVIVGQIPETYLQSKLNSSG